MPPSFWGQPAVATALATCDTATILREVLKARRWNQHDLAHALGYSQSWVSRVLRGQALTVDQVRDICGRVGVPIHLLRLGSGEGDDQTNRRQFWKTTAVAASLAVISPTYTLRRIEADDGVAETLTAVTGLHRRLEATTPSRELAPSAIAHLGAVRAALSRSPASSHAISLLGAVSEAAGFTAWLHTDMRDIGTARTYYRLAVSSARRAQHTLLTGYMMGSLAQFELEEDPALALTLLGQVRGLMGDRPPATARAWLACLEALAHATAKDETAARMALAEAEQAVAAGEKAIAPPWPWVFPFTWEKLAGFRALCAVRLAQPAEALAAFTESLCSIQPADKQRAVLMLEIAAIRRMEGEFEEAFTLADSALSTGVFHASERVVQAARRFRASYTGPTLPTVRVFDERLLAATLP